MINVMLLIILLCSALLCTLFNGCLAIMAFYGYGAMLLILAGVLFAPFLMNSNEVRLSD